MKCVNFWIDRQRSTEEMNNAFDAGEYLLAQWRVFLGFVARIGTVDEACMFAMRQHAFGSALLYYRQLLQEAGNHDALLFLRVGRCYKGKGDYERALQFLEAATRENREDAETLSELADCYALINEVHAAKAMFREALFIDASAIDLHNLESEMIGRLVSKVRELGYNGTELKEWLPVFGELFGVFTVKRELRPIEYGKLKQAIYALEREYHETKQGKELLKPRLLNHYFWLVDHYEIAGGERALSDEVLLKIRSVDEDIHRQYTS